MLVGHVTVRVLFYFFVFSNFETISISNDSDNNSSTDEARKHVISLVSGHLSPTKLKDIKEDKYQSITNVLNELLKQFPSSFAVCDESCDVSDHRFLEWLFPTLFMILIQRQKDDGSIDQITQWIIDILKLKRKFFVPVLQDTLIMLQDASVLLYIDWPDSPITCNYYHQLSDSETLSNSNEKLKIESIPDPPKISLKSQKEVLSLLKVILDIVSPFALQVSLFLQHSLSSCIITVSNLLFHSDKVLREKVFGFVKRLFEVNAKFNPSAINRLCSSTIFYLKSMAEINGFTDNEDCVICLFHVFGGNHFKCSSTFPPLDPPPFTSLAPPTFYQPLTVVLVDHLYNGTYNMMTLRLQECIGVLLSCCWSVAQSLSPLVFFDSCLPVVLGANNNLKPLINVTSSILINMLNRFKKRLSSSLSEEKIEVTDTCTSQMKTSESSKTLTSLLSKLFNGSKESQECDYLCDGESVILCFVNLISKSTSSLLEVCKTTLTTTKESEGRLLKMFGAFCFLVEVYCVTWHQPKLEFHSVVGYKLLDDFTDHLQKFLFWVVTKQWNDSTIKRQILRQLLLGAFQVSFLQMLDIPAGNNTQVGGHHASELKANLTLWLYTLPWKQIDVKNHSSFNTTLSSTQCKTLKNSVSNIFEDDDEVLLASFRGLSSVSRLSWDPVKVQVLQAAIVIPELQSDIFKYALMLLISMDGPITDYSGILDQCLGVTWTTAMMMCFSKHLLAYASIRSGHKSVIQSRWLSLLNPDYSIDDMNQIKSMNNARSNVCTSFQYLYNRLVAMANDTPPVLVELINSTINGLEITGSRTALLLLDLMNHSDDSVVDCLSNYAAVISNNIPHNSVDIHTHPLLTKVKDLVSSGKNRKCELAAKILGVVGSSSKDELFHHCISLLLELMYRGSVSIKAIALVELKEATKFHKISSKLSLSLKRSIWELLQEILNENAPAIISEDAFLHEVAIVFGHELTTFIHSTIDVSVPLLLADGSPNALKCIEFIAKNLKKTPQELYYHYFKYIFTHLVCYCSDQRRQTALLLVESTIQLELKAIIRSNPVNILTNLLLYLHPNQKQVIVGIRLLAEAEDTGIDISVDKDLALYLYPKFLPILKFFDAILVHASHHGDVEAGKLAVSSLTELIKLMGPKYITQCRVNVMALLRSSQKFKDSEIGYLTCSAWGWFVKSVEMDYLGPLLCEIVVALLSFIDKFPDIVSGILQYLIVENREHCEKYFSEVYMMPDELGLSEVKKVLKCASITASDEESLLHKQLKSILKGISHERADIKLHATTALYRTLKENKTEVQKLIVGTDMVDPLVTDLIVSIVHNLKDSSSSLKLKCGECLGMLGAIDPGRLEIPVVAPKKQNVFFEIDEVSPDFAVEFITVLATAFLAAADAQVLNCCAFAIQDALVTFDCSNSDQASVGGKIWKKLPDDIKEIVTPYKFSTYSPRYPPAKPVSYPMFNPSSSLTFKDWVNKWTSHLINKLPNSKPKKLFLPSTLIFKHNIGPARFLLPHVLLCILILQNNTKTVIYQEITAVLDCAKAGRGLLDTRVSMCTEAIFSTLDYLQSWINYSHPSQHTKGKGLRSQSSSITRHKSLIQDFLNMISKELLAQAAYSCLAYTRAMKYLEQHLLTEKDQIQNNLGFLQEIFACLNDHDGVTGVAAIRRNPPSLPEQILQFKSSGNFHDAADCYRKAIQKDPDSFKCHEGLLQCMVNLGEFTSVLHHVNGAVAERHEWAPLFNSYRVESAWKLGDWSGLEKSLNESSNSLWSWGVGLGKVLQSSKKKEQDTFQKCLLHVRNKLMGPLGAASVELGSYQRGYEYIVKLHMLEEVEEFVNEITFGNGDNVDEKLSIIIANWKNRLTSTQESFKTREAILNIRRTLLSLVTQNGTPIQLDLKPVIGNLWLESAKTARHNNCLQTAHNLLLQASDYSLPDFMLEQAEWIRCREDSHQAMLNLQKAIDDNWPNHASIGRTPLRDTQSQTIQSTAIHAKAVLMVGKWMEDTEHESQTILRQYKTAVSFDPKSEECHFCLGKYYDRLLALVQSKPSQYSEVLQFTIQHYGNALEYGNRHIYHCMPRALSLWLDYSSRLHDTKEIKSESSSIKSQVIKINEVMDSLAARLPPYQFLVAFSQLISRVCHPNDDVFATLKEIILKLIEHYPQQSLWLMMAVSKSTLRSRQRRCQEILDKAKKKSPQLERVIKDMTELSASLLEVCFYDPGVASCTVTSMDKVCRDLIRRTAHKNFSSIIVPLQSSLTVALPVGNDSHPDHNPFPGSLPVIMGFESKVEILQSLQKPKKINIRGSDGKLYCIMCKPKDDLRKDSRLIELNSVINKFLLRDPQCRQRRLYIRTFAVIPLNEDSGIIEWVENTAGYRNILYKIYRERGIGMSGNELKAYMNSPNRNREVLKRVFEKELLPKHPPVLGEWFTKMFSDPTAWYSSRQSFCRTVAVMSIVGYIVGLGDRHGENILLDSTNGDCVHVDLSCLFNKGEKFSVPEIVPFRLTHNMINAMGITGYEGTFRTCCEMTMSVLREQRDPLICILKTLIHDPLVEWSVNSKNIGSSSSKTVEPRNEMGVKIINDIEQRLKGQTGKTLPLSVKGQVHSLIKEATDVYNLCQMYVGWGAYL